MNFILFFLLSTQAMAQLTLDPSEAVYEMTNCLEDQIYKHKNNYPNSLKECEQKFKNNSQANSYSIKVSNRIPTGSTLILDISILNNKGRSIYDSVSVFNRQNLEIEMSCGLKSNIAPEKQIAKINEVIEISLEETMKGCPPSDELIQKSIKEGFVFDAWLKYSVGRKNLNGKCQRICPDGSVLLDMSDEKTKLIVLKQVLLSTPGIALDESDTDGEQIENIQPKDLILKNKCVRCGSTEYFEYFAKNYPVLVNENAVKYFTRTAEATNECYNSEGCDDLSPGMDKIMNKDGSYYCGSCEFGYKAVRGKCIKDYNYCSNEIHQIRSSLKWNRSSALWDLSDFGSCKGAEIKRLADEYLKNVESMMNQWSTDCQSYMNVSEEERKEYNLFIQPMFIQKFGNIILQQCTPRSENLETEDLQKSLNEYLINKDNQRRVEEFSELLTFDHFVPEKLIRISK